MTNLGKKCEKKGRDIAEEINMVTKLTWTL